MNKYEKIIETPFKDEIIAEIQTEVKNKFPSVEENELLIFSTNVYIYSVLKAHKIKEQEIADQLLYFNNIYIRNIQEKPNFMISNAIDKDLQYLQYLTQKYQRKIEGKI